MAKNHKYFRTRAFCYLFYLISFLLHACDHSLAINFKLASLLNGKVRKKALSISFYI